MHKNNKNEDGFTLAELLIVVAIIGVLVAISIPIFTKQLEKSREAADLANVRSAYAKVRTSAISGEAVDADVKVGASGVYSADVKLTQKQKDWQSGDSVLNIAGVSRGDARWINTPDANGVCTVTCDPEGNTTINWGSGVYLSSEGVSQNIFSALNVTKTDNIDSNAPETNTKGDKTSSQLIREKLAELGVNMNDMGVAAWHAEQKKSGGATTYDFYVTPVNIRDISKGTDVPVMKYTIDGSGNTTGYSVGTMKVTNDGPLDYSDYSLMKRGTYKQDKNYSVSDYNEAVDALNTVLQNNNYSESMQKMP